MSASRVIYVKRDHIGYLTLNRPEAGNAIDLVMAQELAETCLQVNLDKEVNAVIITGAGETFCSGADERYSSDSKDALFGSRTPAESIADLGCPTLAALNGDACGHGLELALACDIRIAASEAKFGLPQISEGYMPEDGGTQRLPRIVGKAKALEMVLTGQIIDAKEALETGLVNRVFSRDLLMAEIEALAKTIAGKAPLALRYCKEAVNKGLDLSLGQGLRLEADLYFLLHTTADRTEGIKSFLEKRPPEYQGK